MFSQQALAMNLLRGNVCRVEGDAVQKGEESKSKQGNGGSLVCLERPTSSGREKLTYPKKRLALSPEDEVSPSPSTSAFIVA